ncbi:MAG: flagellar motor switch protein FliN [Desulfohalobiaceae bacterium]|nr:flagellar motor switch protein FliN [Desulfohalobiaceae bacterium]
MNDKADVKDNGREAGEKSRQKRTEGSSEAGQTGEQNQSAQTTGIDFLLDVPLQVTVEVGRAKMLIKDFLQMKEGGVIELDKMADEPLDLYVNSRLIARGEAVVVNEKFGLRLIDVVSTAERLEKLR